MARPVIPGVPIEDDAGSRTISAVPTSIAAFVDAFQAGPLDQPVRCTAYAKVESDFGPSTALRQFFENGGREAWVVRASQPGGVAALEKIDLFNILCLPGAPDLPPDEMRAAYAAALACCERRRAFLIVDTPKNVDTPAAMHAWLARNEGLRHRNAAVYFPRTLVADPRYHDDAREIGASGAIAGLYARTDTTRGVWKAPAGIEARLYGVQDFAYQLDDAEQAELVAIGVNCLRTLARFGYLCWSAQTLDLQYISVRRLALFIEESLYRGTQRALSRPSIEAFMNGLFRRGAFAGRTPEEAYFVNCGADNIEVGFAPLKPAEFVIIDIRHRIGL